jgi:uncharacterized Zn finger protein
VSGHGPWSRRLLGALVDDEESIAAERARELARSGRVRELAVEPGQISARVLATGGRECTVTLDAALVPARVWAAVAEGAAGRPEVEEGVAGREQSLHLQHELAGGWGEPLVPPGRSIRASCTCAHRERGARCHHVRALAYALADAIDADPSLVLRWRGCDPVEPGQTPRPLERPTAEEVWRAAGELPELGPARPLPPGAVLMRLGPSGVNVAGRDLAEVLQQAYERFR